MTQKELAKVFGVSPRTIRNWGDRGLDEAARDDSGEYDVAAAVAWQLARVRDEAIAEGRRLAETTDTKHALRETELAKQRAITRKHELDVLEREGSLVHVDDVEEDRARDYSQIRSVILSFPGRLIPRLTRYKTAEALQIVEPAVHDLLETLSRGGDEDEDDARAA